MTNANRWDTVQKIGKGTVKLVDDGDTKAVHIVKKLNHGWLVRFRLAFLEAH
jgi:hypothetical protein